MSQSIGSFIIDLMALVGIIFVISLLYTCEKNIRQMEMDRNWFGGNRIAFEIVG